MKVTFDFLKQTIGIDGDAPELVQVLSLVREIAPTLPSISIVTNQASAVTEQRSSGNGFRAENQVNSGTRTLRQFVRSLPLHNAYERIAAVAYYQRMYTDRTSFSPRELNEWFVQSGFKKPAQIGVALADCRRRHGYVESAGHGAWRITTNGENLIIGKMEEAGELEEQQK